jgi:hypothetical protein
MYIGFMKAFGLIIILICLVSCSKPKADVVGVWSCTSTSGRGTILTLKADHTGNHIVNGSTVTNPLKWSLVAEGAKLILDYGLTNSGYTIGDNILKSGDGDLTCTKNSK